MRISSRWMHEKKRKEGGGRRGEEGEEETLPSSTSSIETEALGARASSRQALPAMLDCSANRNTRLGIPWGSVDADTLDMMLVPCCTRNRTMCGTARRHIWKFHFLAFFLSLSGRRIKLDWAEVGVSNPSRPAPYTRALRTTQCAALTQDACMSRDKMPRPRL